MTSRTPLLPVDQQMRADAEFGAAFRRAIEALPTDTRWTVDVTSQSVAWDAGPVWEYTASAWSTQTPMADWLEESAPTRVAALDALTEALANR